VLTQSLFDYLAERYGLYSSWAIWNPADPRNTQIISANRQHLKNSVIMVGLNVAGHLSQVWSNFHGGRHDRKLMYEFNESTYRGAYMTDIIKGEIETKSTGLLLRIQNGEIDVRKHINILHTEMNDLGAHQHSLFILFGKDVRNLFTEHLANVYPNYVACPHYSRWGTDKAWVSDVKDILEKHYIETKSKFNTLPFA
jgi:hypothetical protein